MGDQGHPGGSGERGVEVCCDRLVIGARPSIGDERRQVLGCRGDIGGQALQGGDARGDGLLQYDPQRPKSGLAHCGRCHGWHTTEAILLEQTTEVSQAGLDLVGREAVGLVERNDRDVTVVAKCGEVLPVKELVRVLLRVKNPNHEVRQAEQAVGLDVMAGLDRVEVGQVNQDKTRQAVLLGAPVPPLDAEPVEKFVRWLRSPDAGVRNTGRRSS